MTESDKKDKKLARKAFRRLFKSGKEVVSKYEVGDEWAWGKDGKRYWKDATEKDMRK